MNITPIKFGTDGWRAIIAKEYTIDNVRRVAEGTAKWMKAKGYDKVVVGHDCRFGGQMFAEAVTQIFGAYDVKVNLAKGFVSTPMVSLGVVKTKSHLGVVITASHNPPTYNGYKLKSIHGGPSIPSDIAEVEVLVPDVSTIEVPSMEKMMEDGILNYVDLEGMYLDQVEANFDMNAIRNSGQKIAYDAMYGAGMNAVQKLLPDAVFLHCDDNPGFNGQAPEPIHRNLLELSETIKNDSEITCGLANDGDADRIGMYDGDGNFVDSHHLLLLLLWYMHDFKGLKGKVIVTFSVTDKMKKLAKILGLEVVVTKIGFKYIAEIMINDDVLVGGEESGGIAVKGHIPERDGIWMGLLIFEFMAKTGKTLKELIVELYEKVGSFDFDRDDLHIKEEQKVAVIEKCENDPYQSFGDYKVQSIETIDGYKFYLSDTEWVMIRPSGTEPVLRVYAQAPDASKVRSILDTVKTEIL
ncbi:MAG: phosphoglucomutase/phosphomannomutase family protein [Saprospiraceae bacterium]|nr:phosphoglucomutase/phosphomannomutase family protein [Saprospiraceae bacterium]MDB4539402.1 phosphoglucomutase/phosphomannomutase family protein [Saprospiraceae bacterium]MDC3210567.1 phosphoglucomutase/phosphomannomutase family protein [Saprospiraceae bacterium]MDG1434558.1 phosphoglucomutase/phosphomannomutase family protein [Saprospiraceae bacterium]MDG2418727.1 phosphoglucomutase/phosphomannomutase family protein [Saprospiraceae bacterium]